MQATNPSPEQVSPDGQWRWNGQDWIPNTSGERAEQATETVAGNLKDGTAVIYVEKKGNGFAVAALVLGIIAILTALLPFIGLGAIFLAIVALGLGIAGLFVARKRGKGMVMTAIAAVLAIASIPLAVATTNAVVNSGTSNESQTSDSVPTGDGTPGIGDKVSDGSFTLTVNDVQTGVKSFDEGLFGTALGEFTIVTVTRENLSDGKIALEGLSGVVGLDSQGAEHAIALSPTEKMNDDGWTPWTDPGTTVTAKYVFDLPAGETLTELQLKYVDFANTVSDTDPGEVTKVTIQL